MSTIWSLTNNFVEEAFASPHLMQTFCQRVCIQNNIRDACEIRMNLELGDKRAFFGEIAKESSKPAFDRLATGPRQRSDRMPREFADGTMGDIYIAVLRAIARTGPRTALTYEDIRARLREYWPGRRPKLMRLAGYL
jgi:hypothetical protein